MINKKLLSYFDNDSLAATVWYTKYRMENEETPADMFERIANEIAKAQLSALTKFPETEYLENKLELLSAHGKKRFTMLLNLGKNFGNENYVKNLSRYFEEYLNFDFIVPAGSSLQGIGNYGLYSSLSNCFVIGQPFDSYSGISYKGTELVELMKRRGGAGIDLSTIRPRNSKVDNQSNYSSGPVLFAHRYSNTTLEVAQNGRRGALMISLSIKHPDSLEFIKEKQDLTKITGANVSVKIDDDFMEAVVNRTNFVLRFPVDAELDGLEQIIDESPLDTLVSCIGLTTDVKYFKKVSAYEYWQTLIECAWKTAEPGIMFESGWRKGGTDWVYSVYRPISSNPCSEIPMQPYDACRLISTNLFSLVDLPFTDDAKINIDKLYDTFYEQLIIADLIIDLEVKHIDFIINKVKKSNDPEHLKEIEINLWTKVRDTALTGRRCGAGFTALGDMLAALNLPYYSPEIIEVIFKVKMKAELDATTDLSILYGPFVGFDPMIETQSIYNQEVISKEFPVEYGKMLLYGRRNVSWSTAAPTGSVSIMTQTTSGIEPLFKAFYKRRKKCILPTERVDYIDPGDGQAFTEFFVLHPKFKSWIEFSTNIENVENLTENDLNVLFKVSPWFGSQADDLNWENRIEIQSIVQKYTTHAISSTINLPKDINKAVIGEIYLNSWKKGLKGNTVYREGSRGGVLVNSNEKLENKIISRPFSLPGHYYNIKIGKKYYSIILGLKDNKPFEIFIISNADYLPNVLDETDTIIGTIQKDTKEWYNFSTETFTIRDITDMETEEKLTSIFISAMLKYNVPLKHIIKSIEKSKPIAGSFSFKLNKILARYIENGEKAEMLCPSCKDELIFENGCVICKSCGWTKC
jgi:ribonucleoside-diphosphate reductase alpha chain